MGIVDRIKSFFGFASPRVAVEPTVVDDDGVVRSLGAGIVERVLWRDLQEVFVITTDEGPFFEDVFFVLAAHDGTGCVVPQGDPASSLLFERLQQLPGFDNTAVIQAMGSTENARFVCWRRDESACDAVR